MRSQKVEIRAVGCKSLAVVVECENDVFWLRDPIDTVAVSYRPMSKRVSFS